MNRRHVLAALASAAALGLVPRGARAEAPGFVFPSIDGGEIDSRDWRGRPALVVNTASLCGFAPQLAAMQALHETWGPKGLTVVATPSNDFDQELDDAKKVKEFCTIQYGITLPMTDILHVKGPGAHPFYAWLRETTGFSPNWNFNKVLLDGSGRPAGAWRSSVEPGAAEIVAAFTPLLPA